MPTPVRLEPLRAIAGASAGRDAPYRYVGSTAWLAVRATPWSDRVRLRFVNTKRTMFRICR